MRRAQLICLMLGLAGLSACQHRPDASRQQSPVTAKAGNVSGNLLAAAAADRYQTTSTERYEQPTADPDNPTPIYPQSLLAEALPPVRVPVRLIVGSGGSVQSVLLLPTESAVRPEFEAAVRAALRRWFFLPLVRIDPGSEFSTVVDDRGTEVTYPGEATALPFHLDYEFVFRQHQGVAEVEASTTRAATD